MSDVFFNAPPNWPVDEDFVPHRGWRPDPAWGPPPPGWALWIREDGEPAGADVFGDAAVPSPLALGASRMAPHVVGRGYWRLLLVWGFALCVLSGVLLGSAATSSNSYSNSGSSGTLSVLGIVAGAAGSVLLVPGMIGWGIHASGLKEILRRD